MRRDYIIGAVVDNFTGSRGSCFEEMVGQRCWLEDDRLKEGNKLIIERKCKDPFTLGVITNVKRCEDCIWVRLENETFRFDNCCNLNKSENEQLPIAESVGMKDSAIGGISIKVNVDTTEIDAVIEKLERLIKLSTMIPSNLLNNK